MTLKDFRNMTAHLPEETPIYYHAYYKGLCLSQYTTDGIWFYPKGKPTAGVVMNPGEDYDARKPVSLHPDLTHPASGSESMPGIGKAGGGTPFTT